MGMFTESEVRLPAGKQGQRAAADEVFRARISQRLQDWPERPAVAREITLCGQRDLRGNGVHTVCLHWHADDNQAELHLGIASFGTSAQVRNLVGGRESCCGSN